MKIFKKVLHWAGLALLILLALSGAMFTGVLPRTREQDIDNVTKTELVEGVESDMEDKN